MKRDIFFKKIGQQAIDLYGKYHTIEKDCQLKTRLKTTSRKALSILFTNGGISCNSPLLPHLALKDS